MDGTKEPFPLISKLALCPLSTELRTLEVGAETESIERQSCRLQLSHRLEIDELAAV